MSPARSSNLIEPRALLFDWDNTLIDSWLALHHAIKATFEALGREPWTLDETRARVRASARDSFPILFGAQAEEATAIFYLIVQIPKFSRVIVWLSAWKHQTLF